MHKFMLFVDLRVTTIICTLKYLFRKFSLNTRIIACLAILSGVIANAAAIDWEFLYRPAAVQYVIYGADLGDTTAPSKDDAKIAFVINDDAAKHIFDTMGPDKPNQCSSTPGVKVRYKDAGKLTCTRSPNAQYACYFGFDLKSGKSIGGSIC